MYSPYEILWKIGELSGCHQMKERSFIFRGRQCPVCARCLGVFSGYCLALILYPFWELPMWMAFGFCLLMFGDWFVQKINIMKSNNIRRFITGIMCGLALIHIYFAVMKWLLVALVQNIQF